MVTLFFIKSFAVLFVPILPKNFRLNSWSAFATEWIVKIESVFLFQLCSTHSRIFALPQTFWLTPQSCLNRPWEQSPSNKINREASQVPVRRLHSRLLTVPRTTRCTSCFVSSAKRAFFTQGLHFYSPLGKHTSPHPSVDTFFNVIDMNTSKVLYDFATEDSWLLRHLLPTLTVSIISYEFFFVCASNVFGAKFCYAPLTAACDYWWRSWVVRNIRLFSSIVSSSI